MWSSEFQASFLSYSPWTPECTLGLIALHFIAYCRSHKHDDAAHNSINFHLVKVAFCLHELELVERR